MATSSADYSQSLTAIDSYLFTRREAILNNWRIACDQDPMLGKTVTPNHEEFNVQMLLILKTLEQRLLGQSPEADPAPIANTNGLDCWQKGYSLAETLLDLNHLTQVLHDELRLLHHHPAQIDTPLFWHVHQQITQVMTETISDNINKYDDLQRREAANQVASLQQVIDQMNELSRQRGELLRTSSHDIRSGFGTISGTAFLLKTKGLAETNRQRFLDLLTHNLTSVYDMFNTLMDMSRLEASEEMVQVQEVDVAQLIRQQVEYSQGIASDRGLILQANVPDCLIVKTDPIQLGRIVQNLLLNALKYTSTGSILVSCLPEGVNHWIFSIQDTGPGLPNNLSSLLVNLSKPTVDDAGVVSSDQVHPEVVFPPAESELGTGLELAPVADSLVQGEGIGLQIVKHLCELLKGNLEVETQANRGTLFRIRLPISIKS